MQFRGKAAILAAGIALCASPGTATAHLDAAGDGGFEPAAGDVFHHMVIEAAFPFPSTSSSDIAFWGDRAFAGNYDGFRVFDIGGERPRLLANVHCPGAQGDPSVWDRDGDGTADLLLLSVDRTMAGPECGDPVTAHDDRNGWEGIRIFDVGDLANIRQIATVYQDCGSHTHTVIPRDGSLTILNSSYPLRPGPTCGPVRGPEAGRDPLHGVVQVVDVPLDDPTRAREVAELPITYFNDNDNNYLPISEHGINGGAVGGSGLVDGMRACHDLAVHVEAGLVGAACGEEAQVWRLDRATGLPDTANPLWVHDQDNVDFWHSATFSWDGKVANFIDESFGDRCPTTTVKRVRLGRAEREYETGNMFFMDARTGELFSEFRIPRSSQNPGAGGYCSSHLGNVVPAKDRYLLANAYYAAGSSIIDFTDPRAPREIAYADRKGAGTWSTYWYETDDRKKRDTLRVFANDGILTPAADRNGFEQHAADVVAVKRDGVAYLNPQTQERLVKTSINLRRGGPGHRTPAGGKSPKHAAAANRAVTEHMATP